MPQNSNPGGGNNPGDGKQPRKTFKIRFNLSWLYLLLILGIFFMVFQGDGANPQKVEWPEVQEMVRAGDVKEIHFVRNDFKGSITIQPDKLGKYAEAFGGPDRAHDSFTPVQKAISYSMTSFFTTGGIRGGKKKLDKFFPRSFNMGIRREVYQQLGGFSKMRFGEDIDFSYRIVEAGYKTVLLPDAWVWHKRRTDFRKFFRQVFNSGIARINLEKRHPGTMKLVHMLPMVFTVGVLLLSLIAIVALVFALIGLLSASKPGCNMGLVVTYIGLAVAALALSPLLLYAIIICIDSTRKNHSLRVGLLSIPAAFVQLMGYGLGFLKAWWKRIVLRQDEFTAFEKNFYK